MWLEYISVVMCLCVNLPLWMCVCVCVNVNVSVYVGPMFTCSNQHGKISIYVDLNLMSLWSQSP